MHFPSTPHILKLAECEIRDTPDKGRGVYATHALPAHTLLEASPVLLFSAQEYEVHGKYTLLDHYAYHWRDGRMALPLGLGSLFNHAQRPNVLYSLNNVARTIRYTTARAIEPGEELCVFYGDKLWFKEVGGGANAVQGATVDESEDGWGGLSALNDVLADAAGGDVARGPDRRWSQLASRFVEGNPDDVILEEEMPFLRVKTTPEEIEEETPEAVRTVEASVIDINSPKDIAAILKWLQQNLPNNSYITHLRRIRRLPATNQTVLLLALGPPDDATLSYAVAQLAGTFGLGAPYSVRVPQHSALTQSSLALKNQLWPTSYAPRRAGVVPGWTRAKARWACEALRVLVRAAQEARASGDLPIAAYIPVPHDAEGQAQLDCPIVAHDTRKSAAHPLRHAVLNAIRALADHRAALPSAAPSALTQTARLSATTALPAIPPLTADDATLDEGTPVVGNGTNYLLTNLILFTTHEPCIMCSMALLHSRVKEVVYLMPIPATGGCGGAACVPRLEGVNHRFGIVQWGNEEWRVWAEGVGVETDENLDA